MKNKILSAFIILFAGTLIASDKEKEQQRANERKFVEDVTLSNVGGNRLKLTRWVINPSVSVFNETTLPVEPVFDHAVKEINAGLSPVQIQLGVMAPRNQAAPLKIVYCERAQFPQTLKAHGMQAVGTRWWAYQRRWDSKLQIEQAVAVISVEQGSEAQAKNSTLQAMMIALGCGNWSSASVESLLGPAKSEPLTALTDVDKKLLSFIYKLQPGAEGFQIRRAFDKGWPE